MGDYWAPKVEEKARFLEEHGEAALMNFRRNLLGHGIDDACTHGRGYSIADNLARRAWHRLGPLLKDDARELVAESPRGMPHLTEVVPGLQTTTSAIEFAYMAQRIGEYDQPEAVCEIGGGYGGLARALIAYVEPVTYTIVDYGPMAGVQAYYLSDVEPPDPERGKVDGTNVVFRAPGQVASAHLYINTRSFMEMDLPEVHSYLEAVTAAARPHATFYCLNREKKVTSLRAYGFEARGWKRLDERRYPLRDNHVEQVWRLQ